MRLAVQLRHVEVDRKDERERDERDRCKKRLSGDVAEHREESRIHDEIGDRVEIPARERDPAGGAGELSVHVVQECLQLQQHRGADQLAAPQCERSEQPYCRIR